MPSKSKCKRVKSAKRKPLPPLVSGDEPPEDIDAFRNALARRISGFINTRHGCWQGCREPVCRRNRRCMAPKINCANARPQPPRTPEQQADTIAEVYKAMQARLAALDAEGK